MTTINIPTYSATIGNLTVIGNLSATGKTFAQYAYLATPGQTFTGGNANTAIQYPTVVEESNISKLTISNTNSRFTNTSGSTMYVFVNALLSPNNPDAATSRMTIRISVNGAAQAIAANTVYYPPFVGTPIAAPLSTSTILKLDNNDYFEAFLLNGAVAACTANNGSLAISQV